MAGARRVVVMRTSDKAPLWQTLLILVGGNAVLWALILACVS